MLHELQMIIVIGFLQEAVVTASHVQANDHHTHFLGALLELYLRCVHLFDFPFPVRHNLAGALTRSFPAANFPPKARYGPILKLLPT